MHKKGRPILVGTTSVEQSEDLSSKLKAISKCLSGQLAGLRFEYCFACLLTLSMAGSGGAPLTVRHAC